MVKVGLTGGIGSGKTTISKMFSDLGIPVYIADHAGKELMETSKNIRQKIIDLLGKESYKGATPNRAFIASKVFHDKELLQKLNQIIHPAVGSHFKQWQAGQSAAYIIYEAAIIFEQANEKNFDYTLLVTAPRETKIKRLLERDTTTREDIIARMDNQWSDEKKRKLASFEINNEDLEHSRAQVKHLNELILKSAKIS